MSEAKQYSKNDVYDIDDFDTVADDNLQQFDDQVFANNAAQEEDRTTQDPDNDQFDKSNQSKRSGL